MHIREASETDLIAIIPVFRSALGSSEEANLVDALGHDPGVSPVVSLLSSPGHSRDIGGKLVETGLNMLAAANVDLVFVPAGRLGVAAPYAIPEKHEDA